MQSAVLHLLSLFKKRSVKFGKMRISGRNSKGQIIVYHRGGGTKKIYRVIDFIKVIWNIKGIILDFIYDPNRSAGVHLILYSNGILTFALAIQNKKIGTCLWADYRFGSSRLSIGTTNYAFKLITGLPVFCIEVGFFTRGQLLRAGGSFGKFVTTTSENCIIKLKTKKFCKIKHECCGTYGIPFLIKFLRLNSKLAKLNIYKGKRPNVRGVAKNPIDHPHGGGQGKTSGGRPSVTRWAQITKGRKTRKKFIYGAFNLEG